MKRWIISDTHFNHENIIKYCDRPFADVEQMNNTIINNWNSLVAHDDIVWHLGDFVLGGKDNAVEVLKRLHGRIRIVLGNHDRFPYKWYVEHFARAYDRPVVIDENVILSHAPIGNTSQQYINLYGHVHNNEPMPFALPFDQNFNYNCCVEVNNYRPIDLDALIARAREQKLLLN